MTTLNAIDPNFPASSATSDRRGSAAKGRLAEVVTICGAHNGPAATANGGYLSGLFAEKLNGSIEVSLTAPAPLDTPLRWRRSDADVLALCAPGGQQVAHGRSSSLPETAPAGVSYDVATAAAGHFPGHRHHPFDTCFVCGTARAGDGLQLFSGREQGAERGPMFAPFVPGRALAAAGSDVVAPRFVAAALDCPGGWASFDSVPRPMVLGRMRLRIEHLPRVGERCVSVGVARGRERRKRFASTALYGDDGRLLGHAEQIWIVLP